MTINFERAYENSHALELKKTFLKGFYLNQTILKFVLTFSLIYINPVT